MSSISIENVKLEKARLAFDLVKLRVERADLNWKDIPTASIGNAWKYLGRFFSDTTS